MIRVLLADDQGLVRSAFALLIRSAPDMEVVGEAADGEAAVTLARECRADVVVMDIRMPGVDGIEATRRIAADDDLAGVRVLILTTFSNDENVLGALRAGASGFLVKDTKPASLLEAIRTVAGGEELLSPGATRALISRVLAQPEVVFSARVVDGLTDREREVLTLIGRGCNNAEIAEVLVISPLTAKTYVSRIMTKLDARDRAQLVITAYESGLVRPAAP
ncbi:LuxR family two component transcriptional regulator [Herbihabitans rhizosphaerae]|uniref:LuxR family two component transcriptional regulator n=1 Tax=Herbihabitans rhizosphaerae TaxID=1872711 RepID=A0A4Q7KDD9_9PSEU|nr:response regulator transcription factor [Herbihabitans rhizosphaerae]RZS29599.1 LuxR family two component transcriptional regulator [Herbihabitans rhizosphaerae]